ncbi:hypothetical protein I7I50_11187 [Histoplasma capsulatum G186AR]|uniref:Uncharacterized protein n=1 Tax=Ajellomyces capsulatus TaxID=5037 RepID=A0A8H7Z8K7_AJECA|nr:hypothetical protein I7I52_02425 [Histoplasma capsulatum]QSS69777.1 hypothetical protein I7I50_11187 [Histoplasma capsulatum G186AR]
MSGFKGFHWVQSALLWFPTMLRLAVAVYRWWIGWLRPLWAEPHHHAHSSHSSSPERTSCS